MIHASQNGQCIPRGCSYLAVGLCTEFYPHYPTLTAWSVDLSHVELVPYIRLSELQKWECADEAICCHCPGTGRSPQLPPLHLVHYFMASYFSQVPIRAAVPSLMAYLSS